MISNRHQQPGNKTSAEEGEAAAAESSDASPPPPLPLPPAAGSNPPFALAGVLDSLLRSCDSIVETSLSFRTLSSPQPSSSSLVADFLRDDHGDELPSGTDEDNSGNSDGSKYGLQRLIRREEDRSKWLDRRIAEKESRLLLRRRMHGSEKSASSGSVAAASSSSSSSSPGDEATAEDASGKNSSKPPPPPGPANGIGFADAAGRLDLERSLLARIVRSRQAASTLFGDGGTAGGTPSAAAAGQQQHHRRAIIRNLVKNRDDQVVRNLKLERELACLRNEVRKAKDECRHLQRSNRERWEHLRTIKKESERLQKDRRHPNGGDELANPIKSSDDDEHAILKGVIVDLIVSVSGVDWYQDDRLRDIMVRLTDDDDGV